MPHAAAHLILLAQIAATAVRTMGFKMAVKLMNNRIETARLGNCKTRKVQRNIKVGHPRLVLNL